MAGMARIKKTIGWAVLLAISLFPIIPWLSGPTAQSISGYADFTHALGQLAGLIGMTMFALTFILSTRITSIEDVFGGLDKVYIAHGILGGTALILLLFHPILLVLKFIPSDAKKAALYLLPSSYMSVNYGILALAGLAFLVSITLYSKIKYNVWKMSHKFLGLIFMIAILHIFLVRGVASRDNIFDGYYAYAAVVSIIGLSGFTYSILLKDRWKKRAIYKVKSIRSRKGFHDLTLVPEFKPLEYRSGQFVFLRIHNEMLGQEAHPFSIASRSNDPNLRIVIKNLGDYTSRLDLISVGDAVSVEGPYGRFNYHRRDIEQIWIAGGIGITPFIGMAEDIPHSKRFSRIDLYYSARDKDDFVSLDTFRNIEKKMKNKFRVIPWVSSEKGRLSVDDVVKTSGWLYGKEIYICGPNAFKRSMKEAFLSAGVPRGKIFEEEFEFR